MGLIVVLLVLVLAANVVTLTLLLADRSRYSDLRDRLATVEQATQRQQSRPVQ
jgi:hypothetical protein